MCSLRSKLAWPTYDPDDKQPHGALAAEQAVEREQNVTWRGGGPSCPIACLKFALPERGARIASLRARKSGGRSGLKAGGAIGDLCPNKVSSATKGKRRALHRKYINYGPRNGSMRLQ